jgi:uncharacterized RDD family membrane protein YckC
MTLYTDKPKNDFIDYSGGDDSRRDAFPDVELADVGARFIALIIDSVLVGMLTGVLALGAEGFGASLLTFIIGAAYQWYFLTACNGQTVGKMLLKIRVVRLDGAPLTASDAVIRYIGYYINSFLFMIGWIWALFDDRHQGFHDKLVNTVVVRA